MFAEFALIGEWGVKYDVVPFVTEKEREKKKKIAPHFSTIYLITFNNSQERVAAGLLGRLNPWDPPMVVTGGPGTGKTVLSSSLVRRSDVRRHFR